LEPVFNIPFHQPTFIGEEVDYIKQAVDNGSWARTSKKSTEFFKNYYPDSTCFFTNSCSSALEMAVCALDIEAGDEVIIPGFGYVAVANVVVNSGATPILADVMLANGNIDVQSVEASITSRTKAVIAIHYAGNPFNVAALVKLCNDKNIYLIEDAAQCMGSTCNNKPLGSFGHLACLSFDYMKNVSCGQGGLLIVNDHTLLQKVQMAFDNGTNKQALAEGTEKEFDWVSKGTNNQINPIASYFLYPQLKQCEQITNSRIKKWDLYYQLLTPFLEKGKINLPITEATHNAHIFYVVTRSEAERNDLRNYLRGKGVFSEHHYSFLPETSFGKQFFSSKQLLLNSEKLCNQLLRLPLSHHITEEEINIVATNIDIFYSR
jgi:dTDP-4-amino-4,6-dideoxygalactose transaminase